MADSQSTVEILIKIAAQKAELEGLQAELAKLRGNVDSVSTSSVQAATGLNQIGKAAQATASLVASSGAAIMSHSELMAAWQAEFSKTEKSLINFGGQNTKLGDLSDKLSQQLLNASRAAAPLAAATDAAAEALPRLAVAQQIANKESEAAARMAEATAKSTGEATQATDIFAKSAIASTQATDTFAQGVATKITPAMHAWALATQEQKAALLALIDTDNASGFERLVSGILRGTAATKGFNTETGLLGAAAKETGVNAASLARGLDQMTAGLLRGVPGAGALSGEIRQLGGGAITTAGQIGLLNTVLIGAGIAGALAFAAALAAIVTKGIEVTKTLQNLGEGVQGVLTTDSSNFGGGLAQKAGVSAIEQITESARRAQVPISELAKEFDAVFPAAARANTSIKGLSDLLANLTSEQGALHISQGKIVTDLEQIFNGTVSNSNVLAQNLGITKEQAAAWREAGTTTEELSQKQQTFSDAHQTSSDTIERANQKVTAAFEQLAAAAVKPIIQPVTAALNDLAATMNTVDASNVIAQFERILAIAGTVITTMHNVAVAVANALLSVPKFINSAVTHLMNPGDAAAVKEDERKQNVLSVAQEQADAFKNAKNPSIDLDPLIVNGTTGIRPPVGASAPKGSGGGGAKGPSQDTQDQQQIATIMAQINEEQQKYNAAVEHNNVEHKLGLESLGKEQSLNLQIGTSFLETIDKEKAKLEEMRQKVVDVANAEGGGNEKEKKQIANIDTAIAKLEALRDKMRLVNAENTFGGQFTKGLTDFRDALTLTGTKAAQVFGQIVNTGIDATASALTGLITGTKNWAQAFQQAGASIIQTLIKVALQSVIGLALQHTVDSAARLESARTAAAGAYSSAAQIPYIGWIIAPFAAAAAFVAVEAFAGGGIVPGAPSSTDNRMAMVATGEGIVNAQAVQYYGPDTIHAMNNMSYATGGIVGNFGSQGGGGKASRDISVNNFWDKDEMLQHVISHPDLQHHIVNTIRKNRFQVKV